ncbi:MAG: acyl-CoA mutase large subunit family protein, partial [Chlorobi bacterium]|nr:acyl-CoA mutase large subunit family protein [Chlorobiota bacterium]
MNTEPIKDKNQDTAGFEPLLSEFTPPTYTQWKEVAVKSLKGKPFEKLISKSYEDIEIQPIYNQADVENLPHTANEQPGIYPYVRGCDETGYKIDAWDISQEIPCETPEEFNKSTLNALGRGQTAINLRIDPNSPALNSIQDFEIAFKNIDLEAAPINISADNAAAVYTQLVAYYKQNDFNLANLRGSADIDPIGRLADTGNSYCSLEDAYKRMSEAVKFAADNTPDFTTVEVNSGIYHEAGANAVQELGFAIATGTEYIKNLINNDVTIEDAAAQIKFNFKVGPNFFMEIAKFRAAKMLWAKIVKEFGGSDEDCIMNIYVKTSGTNMTGLDPYVNMLRTTGESISAIIGGCDSLQVAPFDESIRPSSELTRRLSRNTQIILKEECNMTEVIDPAGGSYYVEYLTDQLMRKAWDLFVATEKLGGMTKALVEGFPQAEIKKVADARIKN